MTDGKAGKRHGRAGSGEEKETPAPHPDLCRGGAGVFVGERIENAEESPWLRGEARGLAGRENLRRSLQVNHLCIGIFFDMVYPKRIGTISGMEPEQISRPLCAWSG